MAPGLGMVLRALLWPTVIAVGLFMSAGRAAAELRASTADRLSELVERCGSDVVAPAERMVACDQALAMEARRFHRATLLAMRGWQKREAGRLPGALRDFEAALKIAPSAYSAQRGQAVVLSDLGRYEEALKLLAGLLATDETNATLYADRGIVHMRAGRDEKALSDFAAALTLRPADTHIRWLRGRLATISGNYDLALADFDALLQAEPQNASYMHYRGLAKGSKDDNRGAISDFNRALALDPTAVGSWFERGKAFERLGENMRALRSYDMGLKLAPKHRDMLFRRAYVLVMLNRYDEAIKTYGETIAADEKLSSIPYGNRAWLLIEKGRYDEAIKDVQRALHGSPKNAQAFYVRGVAQFHRDNVAAALRDIDRALTLGRERTVSVVNYRGRVLLRMKRYREAAAEFDEVVRRDPKALYGYYNRALAAEGMQRWDEALQLYIKALEVEPGEADSVRKRNEMLVKLGREVEMWRLRLAETVQGWRQAASSSTARRGEPAPQPPRADQLRSLDATLELDPYDVEARLRRAGLLAEDAEKHAQGLADLDWILTREPGHIDALRQRAAFHYAEKRFEDASRDTEQVIAKSPKDKIAMFWRALSATALGRRSDAIADYNTIISLDPRMKEARVNRAMLFLGERQFEAAALDCEEAVQLRPGDFDSWYCRGTVKWRQGQPLEALVDLQEALRLNPDSQNLIVDLANLLFKQGRYGAATALLSKIIKKGAANADIWNSNCFYRAVAGDLEGTMSDCDEALRLDPSGAYIYDSRAFLFFRQDDLDAALADFDKAVSIDPNLAHSQFGRGLLLKRKGELAAAAAAFAKARELDPLVDIRYLGYGVRP
ncbi:tetratricopeptide repeat protein [Bosea sp. BK604]|uniref:tetratricopeptide repeat protein n=1 Tax=Bosea sp. BK604 TaxID=2512180 RepID=UPI001047E443|nr:tetratricopeptide repeat protein [Bosea sp. BK604]TCR61684.1 Tfp pilus assembly protein PilF [Bosea sp. BK604]